MIHKRGGVLWPLQHSSLSKDTMKSKFNIDGICAISTPLDGVPDDGLVLFGMALSNQTKQRFIGQVTKL